MQLFKRKYLLEAGIGMAAMLILMAVFLCVKGHSEVAPGVVFACLFLVLVGGIVFMAFALRESLRITLYAYKNIGLIGGMIFLSVFAVSTLGCFFSCLREGNFTLSKMYQSVLAFPRSFSFYGILVILAVSAIISVSNIVLIRREGLSRNNILSLVLASFYGIGTLLVYLLSDLLDKYVFTDQTSPLPTVINATVSMFLMVMLCYFECTFWGTVIMGWVTSHTRASYDKDYIIILGCSIAKDGGLLPLLKGRVNAAVRFAWQQEIATGKHAKYIPSGGKGANEVMSEGSAMEFYLLTRGAEEDEVFPEKESVNTLENLRFSKRIIDRLDPDATIAFATTNYHILRSGILAREAGFDAEGIPGDTKWYFWPNGFIREFFGIIALKKKAHALVAAVIALICVITGCVGYFGSLI